MIFQTSALVAGISFWCFVSRVQAVPSRYVNSSTLISTPSVTTDTSSSTPVDLPIVSTSIPYNGTIQDPTSTEETPVTTAVLPLPTSTSAFLNSTSLYIYPNATTTERAYNTSSTLSYAFNTSTPIKLYPNATATQSRWFTQANYTTRASGATPAPAILSPALPPTLNPHDPVILQPNRSINLYFQAPAPSNGSEIPMANVDIPKMAYPAVVLDHSALITDVDCDLKKLRLRFLNRNALDVAEGSWTMPKFVMMAFHEKCGRASERGERDYLLVHKLKFDRKKLSVSADISHIDIVEAVGKQNPITVDMGSYTPGSLNGTRGFDSQNSQTVSRNGTHTNTTSSADFDVALDDSIGYTTLSSSENIKRFTGLDSANNLVIRGWGWCPFCGKVVKAVKDVVKTVVKEFIPSWTLTPMNKNIDIGLGGGNIMTPFGKKGYQIYTQNSGSNYLRLYCVDCGVNGVVNVKATVTFNLIGLITSGSFSANGWLSAGLGLGIDANYAATVPAFSKTIVAIPLSPFAIPGLITIGPHLDLGVGANAGIDAKGNLYAGLRLNWPAVHAQLNIYGAPSASGWVPSVTPQFQAQGYVQMSASVYATISLGFGVSILNGLKSFGVALVEKPELYVGGTTRNPTCRGLQVSAGFKNSVYADVFGSHHNINIWNGPSTGRCVTIKKRDGLLSLPTPASVEKRGEAKQIKTPDGTIGIHYADNGNLYALPQGNGSLVDMSTISFSATRDGILTGDVESRIFHGYSDTLSAIGVSRLRLSRADHIPKTAVAITLQKSNTPENPNILVALDAAHNVYYPVVCTFGGKDFPRMFLTKDPVEGAKVLMDADNVDDITGAKVDACAHIPLIAA